MKVGIQQFTRPSPGAERLSRLQAPFEKVGPEIMSDEIIQNQHVEVSIGIEELGISSIVVQGNASPVIAFIGNDEKLGQLIIRTLHSENSSIPSSKASLSLKKPDFFDNRYLIRRKHFHFNVTNRNARYIDGIEVGLLNTNTKIKIKFIE